LAACTSPAGTAGTITWNGTDSVIWCNGTVWYALKDAGGGTAAGSTGQIQFNNGSNAFAADSNLTWDNTNKRLGIGTASPGYQFENYMTSAATGSTSNYSARNYLVATPASSGTANFYGMHSRVDTAGASDLREIDGAYNLAMHNGTGTLTNGVGAWNYFRNTNTGTVSSGFGSYNQAVQDTAAGTVTNAYGTWSQAKANFAGATIGTGHGAYNEANLTLGAMTSGYGAYNAVINASAAGTIGSAYGTRSLVQNTSTGTITNAYTLYAGLNNTGTVTNWYGLYIPVVTGTAPVTNRYPLYIADTGPSYFAGNIGIGTTTPGYRLSVTSAGASTYPLVVAASTGSGYASIQEKSDSSMLLNLANAAGTEQVKIQSSGSSWLNGGTVGIGTASPSTTLHVYGTAATGLIIERAATLNSGLEFRQTGGSVFVGIGTSLDFGVGSGSNLDAVKFKVTPATGRLAIIAPDATSTQMELISDRAGIVATNIIGGLDFRSNDSNLTSPGTISASVRALASATHTASELATDLAFYTTTGTTFAEKIRISAAGNVGIGTTAPSYLLSLGGEAARTIGMERTTAGTTGYGLTLSAGGAKSATADLNGGDLNFSSGTATGTGSSNIYFKTAAAQGSTASTDNAPATRMTVLGNGNIGIGTTAPVSLLHVDVASDAAAGAVARFVNTALTTDGNLAFLIVGKQFSSQSARIGYRHDTTSGDEGVVIYNSGDNSQTKGIYLRQGGNVGIGTITPAFKLDVAGDAAFSSNVFMGRTTASASSTPAALTVQHLYGVNYGLVLVSDNVGASSVIRFDNPNGNVGSVVVSGSTTTYTTSSDRRLKENIAATEGAMDKVMRIPVHDFSFKSDSTHKLQTGFIAQELEKVFPEAVTTNGDDGEAPLAAGVNAWSVDYGRVTPLLVKAVQELKAANDNLRATVETQGERLEAQEQEIGALKAAVH
jgi:hypothetical protein